MNRWLALAIMATILATAYWSAFAVHEYSIFHTYQDIELYANDFYYHINYPSAVHGLQYLSFGNHLSPDQLLFLPFYALFQSPLTLLIIQALVMGLTAFMVFIIARDLIKSQKIAFVLFLATLLNPGLWGVVIFDYHVEMLIPLAMLLTFYFFMKRSLWFYPSLLLLLGTMEWGPVMAGTLALALFVYELRINKKVSKFLILIMVISILVFAAYYLAENYLMAQYAQGAYLNLPNSLRLWNQIYAGHALTGATNPASSNGMLINLEYALLGPSNNYNIYALMLICLSFGITAIVFVPDIFLILALPWIGETYLLGYEAFSRIWGYYFSFVMGGVVIATILSFMVMKQSKHINLFIKIALMMLMVFLITYPTMIYSKNVNQLQAQFLFQTSWDASQIAQLQYIINQVPANASIETNQYIVSHFSNRKLISVFGDNSFQPSYLLADFNFNLSLNAENGGQYDAFNALLATGNYSLVVQNGSAQLWAKALTPMKPARMD
jgi:uncharacterized membrane protein